MPDSEGNYSDWGPSTGADNAAVVDEIGPNDDTDYVSSSTATQIDSYTKAALTAVAGSVPAVAVNLRVRDDAAGTPTVSTMLRLSSTDQFGAADSMGASYTYLQQVHDTKPGGGAWSIGDVNNVEFGRRLEST